MPSNEIFSKLLKKSFDILEETSKKRDVEINLSGLNNLLNSIEEKNKKVQNKRRAEKLFGAARATRIGASAARKADMDDLRHYRDPFFSPPKPKKTAAKEISKKEFRKIVERKIPHSVVDYGEQQRELRKKQNSRMIFGTLLFGVVIIGILIGIYT